MNQIILQQTLPEVFAARDPIPSDLWQQDIIFGKGERHLIEAASGTGKSSLCSYLYGYRNDYRGTIRFDDTDIRSFTTTDWVAARQRTLSILFQDLRVFPELTALENVELKNRLTGYKTEKEILALFAALGIADKAHTPVGKISFGQQQRVAFIRSLCQPFDFILLDEPISHLDDENARIMAEILLAEATTQNAGILVTSIGKNLPLDYTYIWKL
ncbi:MAG: ATP-binding cassette domain-containing protein [Bacteroides sp.]|nr:ATP-binding cassette domain-containing protein [Bacteroides sp.]